MILGLLAGCAFLAGGGLGSEPPVRPFGVPIPFAIVEGVRAMDAGDVDGNGLPDLAMAYDVSWCTDESGPGDGCSFVGGADIDLGRGDGIFADETSVPATFARAPLICDMDGNGLGDIVVRTPARIILYLAAGGGDFVQVFNQNVSQTLHSMACDDLDLDGDLDLVVTRVYDNPTLLFFWNAGAGALVFEPVWMVPLGVAPVDLDLGDVDGDGVVDLAWSNAGSTSASAWLGQGDGTFGPLLALETGATHSDTRLADLDDDGCDDLVLGHTGRVSAWLSRAGGGFELAFRAQLPSTPVELLVAPLDTGAPPDLVVLDFAGDLHGFAGRGDGTFDARFPIGAPFAKDMDAADVDGDGQLDLLGLGHVEGYSLLGQGVPWPVAAPALAGGTLGTSPP